MSMMKRMIGLWCCALMTVSVHTRVLANNIQVSNVTLTNQNSATQTVEIQFDVSWENSWRLTNGPANWDAAWAFVKFHDGDNNWRHVHIATNDTAHTAPAGALLRTGLTENKGMGVFIYRNETGSGDVAFNGVRLLWHYAGNDVADAALITLDVTAIEMVYVPEGPFYLGDGTPGGANYSDGGNLDNDPPFLVTGEGEIPYTPVAGALWMGSSFFTEIVYSNVPPAFPKGYQAIYCMKYPVSQGQYIDAYNKNPTVLVNPSDGTDGYGIVGTRHIFSGSAPNRVAAYPDRAFRISIADGFRYLEWTGLRPMSEMEYEKACRGPLPPVRGEYAWGTAVAATLPYTLADDGTPDERVAANYDEHAGNAWYWATRGAISSGPARVGMFAKDSYSGTTSGRIQSGATYYGIMNMSDNVSEPMIRFTVLSTSSSSFNLFDGAHGRGTGIISGLKWGTGGSAGEQTSRGGSYASALYRLSERAGATSGIGIRGVRTAP